MLCLLRLALLAKLSHATWAHPGQSLYYVRNRRRHFFNLWGKLSELFMSQSPHYPHPGLHPPLLSLWRQILGRSASSASWRRVEGRLRRPSVSRWPPRRAGLCSPGRRTLLRPTPPPEAVGLNVTFGRTLIHFRAPFLLIHVECAGSSPHCVVYVHLI